MEDYGIIIALCVWACPGLIYGLANGMLFESLFIAPALGIFSPFLLHSMKKAKMRLLTEPQQRVGQAQAQREAKRWQDEQLARQREADVRRAAEEERQRQEEARRKAEESRHARSDREPARDERYYGNVLGLKGQVRPPDVKRRYRELVAQYHPDKVNHLGPKLREVAEREMKVINEAYDFFKRTYDI
jgi:hypothetical protein